MNQIQPASNARACNGRGEGATTVVLGIGNVLWADEGFGVRCVERLQSDYEFSPEPVIVDGGTQGLYLIRYVQMATRLLIFDAIDYGLAPGALQVIRDEDVPEYLGAKKMSLHQTGFQEVLALARLTGTYPEQVVLIGCQPQELDDYGGSLREPVREALEQAVSIGVETLAAWGCEARARQTPLSAAESVTLPHLAMARYEAERPSADQACRIGDSRFMPAGLP